MNILKKEFSHLPIAQIIRIRSIEVLVNNYGFCQRQVLSDLGGISITTASRDIAEYIKMNDGVYYNRNTKRIEKTSTFKELF